MDFGCLNKEKTGALSEILFPESPLVRGTRSARQSDRHIFAYQSLARRLTVRSLNEMRDEYFRPYNVQKFSFTVKYAIAQLSAESL
jgi:hypothetical protein